MAEGDGAIFNNFKEQLMLGTVNLDTDTLKVMLVTGWSASVDGTALEADFDDYEESGTGYTTGGETLGSTAVAQDDTNNRASFDAADVTWTGLDVGTPSHAIIWDDTHASDIGVAYWELGRASNGSDYKITWHTDGILLLT